MTNSKKQTLADLPDFQRRQFEFAGHIRDPDNRPAPDGVEDRRMAVYRNLFFNNLLNLLSGTFPVLKKLHSRDKWRSIVRQFMRDHRAQTPYFMKIPGEFLGFLENEYKRSDDDYPFLVELAHYEWAELALSVSEETNDDLYVDADGDLVEGVPVKSRLAWLLSYQFPVHRISPEFRPAEPGDQPTYLTIYRRSDDDLGFMEMNPVSARLLQLIEANESATGRELLQTLAAEMRYPDVEALITHGKIALEEMHHAEILLGTARSSRS